MLLIKRRNNYKEKFLKLFNKNILYISKDKNSKKKKYIFFPKQKIDKTKQMFYLKVNKLEKYSFLSLQHWINIIKEMNADFIIICDKKELEKQIYKKINFYDDKLYNIKFIKSYSKPFKNFINKLVDPFWVRAGNAHLTTYYHAKLNNIENFWNIDADDTTILLEPNKIAGILKDISNYANKNNISNLSLDMWRSRTAGKQWSFGITYTNMNIDYFDIFEKETNLNWRKYRKDGFYLKTVSLDCYFTYCRDVKNMKNETFYIENMYFIHWGDFLFHIFGSWFSCHKNNVLYFPILDNILHNKDFSKCNIDKDCIKFDYNIKEEEGYNFLNNKFVYCLGEDYINFLKVYYGLNK